MPESEIKVALIGAGNWGRNLVENFYRLGVLDVVVDEDERRLSEIEKKYPNSNVKLLNRTDELWNMPIPAVAIATPVATHYALAKAALRAKKDVFVEKPLAIKAHEAEELSCLAQENSCLLMVGHLLLYQPAIRYIKDFIIQGKLGKLYSLHQERLNLGRARAVENALWSLGVHDVAVFLDLVGEKPCQVKVTGQQALQPGIEDDVYLHLSFPGEVFAHLHASWLWPEKRRRLTVIGEKGMLVYDEIAQTVTWHKKSINSKLENVSQGEEVVFHGDAEPLKIELSHFIECCKNRAKPYSDGERAVQVVEVLEKAQQQLEEG